MQQENWDDLRFVLAAARHGNVAVAAEALGVNESTITRRLSRVESAFGTTLFFRSGGRLEPSDAARAMLEQLYQIDTSVDRIRSVVAGADELMQGTVRITSAALIINHAVVPNLANLVTVYPDLRLELVASTAMMSVTHREADIAIRLERPSTDPDAITRKLGELTYGIYASTVALARPGPLPWIGLDHSPAVSPLARWYDTHIGEPVHVAVSDNDTSLRCVLAGLGKSLLPDAVARRHPELVRCEDAVPDLHREVWIMCHPSQERVRRLRETTRWLGERISAFLHPG